jgi:hypothetical protein
MPLRRRSSNGSETFAKRFVQVLLNLTVFDLLRPRNDLRQPLPFNDCCDPVAVQLLHWNSHTLHAVQRKYILRFILRRRHNYKPIGQPV